MRKLTVLLLTAALLAGCASAPADSLAPSAAPDTARSEAAPTEAPSAPEATPADTTAEQQAILEQLVDFGADTAGGSLKTACAAAALVEGHYRKKLEAGRRDLVIAALQRRGFSYSVIKEAIRRIEEE